MKVLVVLNKNYRLWGGKENILLKPLHKHSKELSKHPIKIQG